MTIWDITTEDLEKLPIEHIIDLVADEEDLPPVYKHVIVMGEAYRRVDDEGTMTEAEASQVLSKIINIAYK